MDVSACALVQRSYGQPLDPTPTLLTLTDPLKLNRRISGSLGTLNHHLSNFDQTPPPPPLPHTHTHTHSPTSLGLVESTPENLTYPAGSPSHLSTYKAWMQLLTDAKETVDIASFYWTLRGHGSIKDPTDKEVRVVWCMRDW